MWLNRVRAALALLLCAFGARCLPVRAGATEAAVIVKARPYRLEECGYCQAQTWCWMRDARLGGKPQCSACQVVRFFERVLYPPFGYKLQWWQREDLRALYGNVSIETGLRIYRRAYESMAKQNGKSFLLGGLPIYHLVVEGDYILQPEAYGLASAKDQAAIVFKAAAMLVQGNSLLRGPLKIVESTKRIVRRDGGGIYAVLSADGDVQDGKRASLLLIDELHRFTRKKQSTVRTVLLKGMMSRSPVVNGVETGEPLMIQTTTSGDEFESPDWAAEYDYARHVADGSIIDPSYYARIYQADSQRIESDPEYWKSREARVAANPSHEDLGGFLADRVIEAEVLEAIVRPEKYADVIRLNLNVPIAQTETPVVKMQQWYANGGETDLRRWPEYDVELLCLKMGLKGRACYAGADLAWTTDMAALSLVFPPAEAGEKWKLLFFAWLPQNRIVDIERITRAPLADWVHRKFVETTPGDRIKQAAIEDRVRWAAREFELREFCFDPWGGMIRSAETLAEEGITCVQIDQTIKVLTAATKEFIELYINGEFEHANNPVANWHVSCLSLNRDQSDNVKPSKPERDVSKKRIDLVAATVNAMVRATVQEESEARILVL